MLGDPPQIVGDHTPANPSPNPRVPMIPTPDQPLSPFEPTDPPLDPRAPVPPTPEPALPLVGELCRRLLPRTRQHDLSHPTLLSCLFIRRRRQLAIPCQQRWRTPKLLDVLVQARRQIDRVVGIAL